MKRYRIKFYGIVQGVGFRPFIYRVAKKFNLNGFVQNRSDCVLVEVESDQETLQDFINFIKKNSPPASKITKIEYSSHKLKNYHDFKIVKSKEKLKKLIHIPPDIATCKDCINELFNPDDRRYLYPFINCTNCGPRLTIIKDIPYDRKNTSMNKFKMCNNCLKEYENPEDRRFHAEPIACPECGPQVFLMEIKVESGRWKEEEIIHISRLTSHVSRIIKNLLKQGKIIAIKGLGGFHLCCDATNFEVVKKLRERKLREEKPFAIMVRNINSAKKIAYISQDEENLLLSPQCPIVLLKKKKNTTIADNVAPSLDKYGIMLPYTPIHHLILREIDFLIMTSANLTDEPICIENREAIERLKDIADYFLLHNRDILVRCDDSIAAVFNEKPVVFRHSRGYSPSPIILKKVFSPIMALGGHLKNSICIIKDNYAFLSPHIGDLDNPLARDFFIETIETMKKITDTDPEIIAIDMHPTYFSSQFALMKLRHKKIVKVQHHHAHIVSCMAENGISGKVIGIACDGTGYGTDENIWGGEIFIADEKNFKRSGHINYFKLIGGEIAIKEIYRIGIYFLIKIFGEKWEEYLNLLEINVNSKIFLKNVKRIIEKNVNCVNCSSLGRLFDAVSVILGIREYSNYEGQAAMEMEAIAQKYRGDIIDFSEAVQNNFFINPELIIKKIIELRLKGESIEKLAYSFHFAIINAFVTICKKLRDEFKINRIVLSGGCFQNRILTENLINELTNYNFEVFFHAIVPPNDGGISLGQAIIVGEKLKN